MRPMLFVTVLLTCLAVWAAPLGAQTKPAPKPASKPAAPAAPKPAASAGMTNADVIKMVKAGLGEPVIIASIKQAEKRAFVLTADGLVELKVAGVSDRIIHTMLDPAGPALEPATATASAPAPAARSATTDAPPTALESAPVSEIGVYYRNGDLWADLLPEVVNWKTGGVLKHLATAGVMKGDVNGLVSGRSSKTPLKQPITILVYTPEGVAITEYQLLRLRGNSDSREFRTVTGGVMHASGGATRDLVPFDSTKIASRTNKIVLDFTNRGRRTRIIGARKTTARERRDYEQNTQKKSRT